MNRFGLSIIVLIFSITGLFSQNNTDAEKVINELLASVRTSAVKTNFRLSSQGKNAVTSQSVSGTFIMKANKFTIDTDDSKAWFDGKTQWTYMKSDNEVSITEPTEEELIQINPMAILASFKSKSSIRFAKTKQSGSKVIELIPKNKKDEFIKTQIQINNSTGYPENIRLFDKKGTITQLTLSNYIKVAKITDETFVFNKSKFKGVVMNDLR